MDEAECQRLHDQALRFERKSKLYITEDDFHRFAQRADLRYEKIRLGIEALLQEHPEKLQASTIEAAMFLIRFVGEPAKYNSTLARLLLSANHMRHEDIAYDLQQRKDPSTVDALFHAAHARYDYLDYDQVFGLARKCTWALADIGTPEAFAKLQMLEKTENNLVAGYARKRIESWDKEKSRKRSE